MPYLGKSPSQGVRSRYHYIIGTTTNHNAGVTRIYGADANGSTLTFTDGNYVDVYLNGVMLKAGVDYNTTTANEINGLSATAASDVVDIIVYDTFSLFGGTLEGNVKVNNGTLNVTGATDLDSTLNVDGNATFGGTINTTGTSKLQFGDTGTYIHQSADGVLDLVSDTEIEINATTIDMNGALEVSGNATFAGDVALADNKKATFGGGSDLQIYYDGTDAYIKNHSGGKIIQRARTGLLLQTNATDGGADNAITANQAGSVELTYANVKKFETTNTGIDVTGGIVADHHVNIGTGMSFQWGDSHERIEQSDGNIEFFTGNGEKMRLHGSTLVIGKDSADTTLSGGTPPFQVIGTGSSASIAAVRREANAYGSSLILAKSRGTTVNSFSNSTKLSDNDALGYILFIGDDGTDLDTYGATIHAEVNGTPGSNDMPADLVFSTNGGSSSATERMRIDSSGNVGIGVTSPKTKLQIVGENNSSSTPLGKIANSQLHLDHTTHTNAISQIGFGYSAGTYSTASIGYISTLVNNYGKGDLFFATRNVNTDTAPTERFRIATAGQLGIGGANYGTSGQVLTSGGASAAPSWADAGGGNWTTISESTVSNQRTVNFTVAAGYWYRLYITNLYLHSATRQLFAQFSTDGGSNFISSGYTVWAKTNYASSTTVQVSTENTWSYGVMITKEHLGAGADSANNMIIDYYQPTGYQFRMWGGHSNLKNSNSTHDGTFILKDLSNSSTAVNYIRLTNYGANSGTQYYIYGKFKLMRME